MSDRLPRAFRRCPWGLCAHCERGTVLADRVLSICADCEAAELAELGSEEVAEANGWVTTRRVQGQARAPRQAEMFGEAA